MHTLKVVTYNTHHGVDLKGRNCLQRQSEDLQDFDLAFLQELDCMTTRSGCAHQLDELSSKAGYRYGFYAPNINYDNGLYGTGLLSKRKLGLSYNLICPQLATGTTCDIDGKLRSNPEQRGILVSSMVASGRPILLIGHHASLWKVERKACFEMIASVLRSYNGPAIIAGDMNSQQQEEMDVLRELTVDVGYNLKENLTYPSDNPLKRIDYILVREFSVVKAEVISTSYSDHRPVSAVLKPSWINS